MGVREDNAQKARATMNARAREAYASVEWPSHVAFMDTTEEWELRLKGRRF